MRFGWRGESGRGILFSFLVVLALVAAACGGGGEESSSTTSDTQGDTGTVASTPTNDGSDDGGAMAPQPFSVGKEAWQAGFHMTFGDGLFTAESDALTDEVTYRVTIDTTFENLSDSPWGMGPDQFALVVNGNATAASLASELPTVPGGLSSGGTLDFLVDENFDAADSILIIGYSDETQAQVPLGEGELISLEPSTQPVSGAIELELLDLTFNGADLHYDNPDTYSNVEEGNIALTLHFDAVSRASGNWNIFADNFALSIPDGSAVAPYSSQLGSLPGSDEGVPTQDLSATFLVPDPPAGAYTLRLTVGDWFVGNDGVNEGTLDFNLS